MPKKVLPLVLGAAAVYAAGGLGLFGAEAAFGAGSLFGTIPGAIISGVVSTAASALLAPKAHSANLSGLLNNAGAGRTQQVRQPIAPHQVIFGRGKYSGPILGIHTADDDDDRVNGYLYLIHGLAGHHVKVIEDVYFNDDFSTDEKYDGFQRVNKHLGETTQVADVQLVAEIPAAWTADHRLRGRAYIATRLKWDVTAFSSGIPNIVAIVWGSDEIYDPRDGSIGWTNNAALCIAKWFTADFGMGLAWSDLDEDAVIAAANICDERVLVSSGSATFAMVLGGDSPAAITSMLTLSDGARSLDVGDGVRLSSTGTLPTGFSAGVTYYVIPSDNETIKLASSAANAKAGAAITPTSVGSGTRTLTYHDEARYKLNGQFTLDASKGEVLQQLLSAMAGIAVYIGGKWFLHAGAPSTPTVTLTTDDLRGDLTYTPKRSMRDRFNGVRAVYVNPDANWQPVDAPPLVNDDYLDEDDGEELNQDLRYPFTISTRAVQRLQKIALESNRRQGIVQFPAKLTAMRLQPWDGVYLTVERYGWTQKQFRVIAWALSEDGGGIDLTLQEDDALIHAWTAAEEIATAIQQGVVLPDPSVIAAPESITVTTPTEPTYDRVEALIAEVKSIWLAGYDPEYRDAGTVDWTAYGRVPQDASRLIVAERSTPQDFRVRSVTKNGSASEFIENLAPDTPTAPSAAMVSDSQINVDVTSAAFEVQIFSNTVNTLATATLVDTVDPADFPFANTGLSDSTQYFYWFRAANADGNISAATASVNATTDT